MLIISAILKYKNTRLSGSGGLAPEFLVVSSEQLRRDHNAPERSEC